MILADLLEIDPVSVEQAFFPPRPKTEIDYFPRWDNQAGEGWAVVEIVGSGWSPGAVQDFNGSGA